MQINKASSFDMCANQSKSIAEVCPKLNNRFRAKQRKQSEPQSRGSILVNCVSLPFKCVCRAIELPNVSHKTQSRKARTLKEKIKYYFPLWEKCLNTALDTTKVLIIFQILY